MSYSFSVKAATKAEAKVAVAAEMDKVVQSQPTHAQDRDQAVTAASAFIDLVGDDDTKDVSVSVSGWLSWLTVDGVVTTQGASVSVSANLVNR